MWIPSHIGLRGNEIADKEANKARSHNQIINTKLGKSEVRSNIKKHIKEKWIEMWNNSTKGRKAHKTLDPPSEKSQLNLEPKVPANKTIIRLKLGKTKYSAINKTCEACQKENTVEHYLTECQNYTMQRKQLIETLKNQGKTFNIKALLGPENNIEIKRAIIKYTKDTAIEI